MEVFWQMLLFLVCPYYSKLVFVTPQEDKCNMNKKKELLWKGPFFDTSTWLDYSIETEQHQTSYLYAQECQISVTAHEHLLMYVRRSVVIIYDCITIKRKDCEKNSERILKKV